MNQIKQIFNRYLYIIGFAVCLNSPVQSQIQNIEYFFDHDPGFGNASALNFTPADEVSGEYALDISTISTGFHCLGIRAKNASGWGQTRVKSVYNLKSSANSVITNVEYFIGNDPGYGNANALTINPTTTIQEVFALDLSETPTGFNCIGFRCKTENGDWGQTKVNSIYNIKVSSNSVISNIEYFIDNDPGKGNANALTITPAKTVQGAFGLDLSEIPTGFHYIGFRCKSENGDWGQTKVNSIYNIKTSSNSIINNIEYFIDNDPGKGNANSLTISPSTTVQGAFGLDLSEISTGFHYIGFRCKTENGDWGQTKVNTFYSIKSSANSTITNMEYFIDNDPGMGSANAITITPGLTVETSININATTLTNGYHTFGGRCKTENGDWGLSFTQLFYVDNTTTEIIEVKNRNELISIIYPNPTKDEAFVKLLNVRTNASVDILNLDGKVLIQKKFTVENHQISERISLGNLPNGTYLVRITCNNTVKLKKIIIEK